MSNDNIKELALKCVVEFCGRSNRERTTYYSRDVIPIARQFENYLKSE